MKTLSKSVKYKQTKFNITLSKSSPISSLDRNEDINPDSLPRTDIVKSAQNKNSIANTSAEV